ncbi:pyruvate/2-oxoglutarate dehydrogenase complex dihydrolipoamide acyltransferase (E2) component [Actinopolyspora biskrensis]|uniref:Pyruvate/2-oxoglutarate dehydrogenase complex dihydrolipoamide acyltransferase (E2) component n=1 Tax=Actinopolyspora biskrensis TaxID=1470178 RepID=A0A852Z7W8_9ACTN|nr:biotin/lipoyl-containing protein [Actinopolyspora biskrensis]NYH79636.1 pyruvate/2-oxoglutarate dehydrogenase complex dihydrolipoamide acyltransferase (E2) component [Actinopolyspora biskrensis]
MTELLYCAERPDAGGFGTARAVLVRWLVAEGSPVRSGQPLAEIRTGQHHTRMHALATGTLRQQVRAGEPVLPGFPVGLIE